MCSKLKCHNFVTLGNACQFFYTVNLTISQVMRIVQGIDFEVVGYGDLLKFIIFHVYIPYPSLWLHFMVENF